MNIVIVGGGFAGVSTALSLSRAGISNCRIILISDKSHFEYHAALYRVVTGRSPLEVCIPLSEIFKGTNVEVVCDMVTEVNTIKKYVAGTHKFAYDYLVLALGGETSYFSIPGLKELSFGFKSIHEALKLKRHLHEVFESCKKGTSEQKICAAHLVVVGGGASGVELAGELALYANQLAKQHDLEPSLVTIDLIEAAPRLLPLLPEKASQIAQKRIHGLGVNLFLNRAIVKEEIESVFLKDMQLKTQTVIWTAGISANNLYWKIPNLTLDKKGRVLVDDNLLAQGFKNIFIAGDGAVTKYSGMAQTALRDGRYIAKAVKAFSKGQKPSPYNSVKPFYSIPIGSSWALTLIGPMYFTGWVGWFFRRYADFRFFYSVLPLKKAIAAFRSGQTVCESCDICDNL